MQTESQTGKGEKNRLRTLHCDSDVWVRFEERVLMARGVHEFHRNSPPASFRPSLPPSLPPSGSGEAFEARGAESGDGEAC